MQLATALIALSLPVHYSYGETCDLSKITVDLAPIVAPAVKCETATGVQIIPPVTLPSADQVKDICSECTDLVESSKTTPFSSCTISISGQEIPFDKFFDQITGHCDSTANTTTTAPPTEDKSSGGVSKVSNSSAAGETPTSTPYTTSAPKSSPGLASVLGLVGSGVVLFVLIVAGCMRACCKRREGQQHDKVGPLSPSAGDYVYEDLSTHDIPAQEQFQMPTRAARSDIAAVPSLSSLSGSQQTIVDGDDDFPGQLLIAVRIPLEDLKIRDVISQGAFGEVLFATYKNQDVAVKRLLVARRRDSKSVSSFVQEIKLNATLDHECLVRFIGAAWDVRENLCMVSEYVCGGDLRTLMSEYARSGYPNGHDRSKIRTALQIVQALTYLHTLNPPVVHRDLKSRNVLLTEVLDAKLIDLGVSTECVDETMTAGVGTSLWMAPEVMMGKRYDIKADVFSFGVILSELDTHEIPYDHVRDPESDRKLASALLNRLIYEGKVKPRFTERADPEIVALARDCLEVDPSKRPTSAQVLDRIRYSGRQGLGRPKSRTSTVSSRSGTQSSGAGSVNSLLFETRATTQSGAPE